MLGLAGFSLVVSGGYALASVGGLLIVVASPVVEPGSRHAGFIVMACGFSGCGSQTLEQRFTSWSTGLDALRHVQSSQTKD